MKYWQTFNDRVVSLMDMEHQHMSNIYYFINYVVPESYSDSTRIELMHWLKLRFGGCILPYHPCPEFKQEIKYLQIKGYLKPDNYIVINNRVIGSLKSNK